MEFGLSLGSNLGDRLENLRTARELVSATPGVRVTAQSPVYETEPVDVRPAFRDLAFLNAVLVVESSLPPEALLATLQSIEKRMGRRRGGDRNAPRPIDIDIVYAQGVGRAAPAKQGRGGAFADPAEQAGDGGDRLAEEPLILPHPRWFTRRFVVQPLADVRPDQPLPPANLTPRQALLALPPTPKVVVLSIHW